MTSFASPATESLSENRTGLFLNQMPGFAGVEGGLNAGLHRVYKTFSYDFAPGSLVGPKRVPGPAHSANAQSALASKLRGLEKAQNNAANVRNLPDGRIRYYTKEVPATKQGPTRGASYVIEYNPQTGQTRSWMESYDHSGNVVRVHPKSINGQSVSSPHYPPTGREVNP